jgi:hypothetical protein
MSANVTLYELADMRDVLDTWFAETEGEVTVTLEELLAQLQGQANEKIERVALYIREQIATAEAIEAEAKRLQDRAQAKLNAASKLKDYLKIQMERLGVTKVNGLLCTVAIQRNSQPSVTTAREANELYALDDVRPFVKREEKVVYTLDRTAILAAWKANQPLPEAIVVDLGSHVRIR